MAPTQTDKRYASRVSGVVLQHFALHEDMRGALTVGSFSSEIPFEPKRYFMVFNVPSKDVRGERMHIKCVSSS